MNTQRENQITAILFSIIVTGATFGLAIQGTFTHTWLDVIAGFTLGVAFPVIVFVIYRHKYSRAKRE